MDSECESQPLLEPLAHDIDAILSKLMAPVNLMEIENILMVAKVLKTLIDICRTNSQHESVEEHLKGIWTRHETNGEKWHFFVALTKGNPVSYIALRILNTKDGALGLPIIQEFYRLHYSKEDFKDLMHMYQKSALSISAGSSYDEFVTSAECDLPFQQHNVALNDGKEIDIVTLAKWHGKGTEFSKYVEQCRQKVELLSNDTFLNIQIRVLRSLHHNKDVLRTYIEALRNDRFYQLNLALLKRYHDRLIAKNILYDNNVVMLTWILGRHDTTTLRKQFLNETRFGSSEKLRIILLELQNFS